ncbi:MAG: methionyl-tRNA formyltransferase [Candidatus Gastranaerophilales bacterium]|nr:methionyl-tRNA formyltransferase [Candidatus Gastranaerophilales bacterium]
MTKIVIVGYDQMFANLITGCILAGYEPVGVFRHDKVKYPPFLLKIKDVILPSKDKAFIDGYNLHEIDARSVNSEQFRRELVKLNADLVFIGSWSEKFSEETINVPKIATINCHPSLLPKYRGPNPYAQVILHGETKTGITFHLADKNYDSGAILLQKEVEIKPDDTGGSLKARCVKVAETEIGNLLHQIESEIILPVNQKEENATYYPQFTEKDVLIDFEKTSAEIDRRIRAFLPWSKCYLPHKNEFLTFKHHEVLEDYGESAAKLIAKDKNSITITAGDKKLIRFSGIKVYKKSFLFTKLYTKFALKIGDIMK